MAETITNFGKATYQYVTDKGVKKTLTVRSLFNGTAHTGLGATDGTEVGPMKAHFARHLWLTATTRAANGNVYRRKVYFNPGALANITNADFNGLDGLNWSIQGHKGEKSIASG